MMELLKIVHMQLVVQPQRVAWLVLLVLVVAPDRADRVPARRLQRVVLVVPAVMVDQLTLEDW
jgi:hypothetical protein